MRAAVAAFCAWLELTPFSRQLQTREWVVPAVQTVHLLAIAAVMGAMLLFNLRLLGLRGIDAPLARVSRRFLPVIWTSVLVLLVSGAVMIAAEPARSLLSPAFQLKMVLLLAALALTAATGRPLRHSPDYWGASRLRGRVARVFGTASIGLWVAVLCLAGGLRTWGSVEGRPDGVRPVTSFLERLYATGWANAIRENEVAFPWIECVHVLAITLVVGSISVVDLRLLGVAWRDRPVQRVLRDVLPLTWAAFGLAVASGSLLFASNAPAYARNPYLQAKMALLVLAGLNMASFHWWARRSLQAWGNAPLPPWRARLAGGVSLLCWLGVVAVARWIGFTMLAH